MHSNESRLSAAPLEAACIKVRVIDQGVRLGAML